MLFRSVAELVAGYDNAAVVRNPLDSSALGGHDRMTPFFLAMEQDGFDGPVVTYTHMLPNPKMSELVAGHMVARRQRTGSPVVIVVPGGLSPELETIYRNNGIPLFHDMATCFDSLACHYQTLDAGTQDRKSTRLNSSH